MTEVFDKTYWDEHYGAHETAHPAPPSPHMVIETEALAPGSVLDAGCGEGSNASWLASRGWRVTAVDIASTALNHARERAETLGADVSGRITWVQADLTSWTPTAEQFDLVMAHYVHTTGQPQAFFRRLATLVAPGGTLLVVDHHHPTEQSHPSAQHTDGHGADGSPPDPEPHITAAEIAASLDSDQWDIITADARTRTANDREGHEMTLHDTVLRARKYA